MHQTAPTQTPCKCYKPQPSRYLTLQAYTAATGVLIHGRYSSMVKICTYTAACNTLLTVGSLPVFLQLLHHDDGCRCWLTTLPYELLILLRVYMGLVCVLCLKLLLREGVKPHLLMWCGSCCRKLCFASFEPLFGNWGKTGNLPTQETVDAGL